MLSSGSRSASYLPYSSLPRPTYPGGGRAHSRIGTLHMHRKTMFFLFSLFEGKYCSRPGGGQMQWKRGGEGGKRGLRQIARARREGEGREPRDILPARDLHHGKARTLPPSLWMNSVNLRNIAVLCLKPFAYLCTPLYLRYGKVGSVSGSCSMAKLDPSCLTCRRHDKMSTESATRQAFFPVLPPLSSSPPSSRSAAVANLAPFHHAAS